MLSRSHGNSMAKSLFGRWRLSIKHVAGGPENAILSSGGLDLLVLGVEVVK
jgi:hypothetical protein